MGIEKSANANSYKNFSYFAPLPPNVHFLGLEIRNIIMNGIQNASIQFLLSSIYLFLKGTYYNKYVVKKRVLTGT